MHGGKPNVARVASSAGNYQSPRPDPRNGQRHEPRHHPTSVVLVATAHRSAVRVIVGGLQIEMSPQAAREFAADLVDSIEAAESHSTTWKKKETIK